MLDIFHLLQEQEAAYSTQVVRANVGDVVRLIAPGGRGASELPPMISYIESLGK